MPLIPLLRLGSRIWEFVQQVVEGMVVSETAEDNEQEDANEKQVDKNMEKENVKEKPVVVEQVSLFPKKHNVDLDVFKDISVTPCGLDLSTTESSMALSVSSEGNVSCQLKSEPLEKPKASAPITPESNNAKTPTSDSVTPQGEVGKDTEMFVCHYCDAKFRIRGYLTRHIKKHAIEKAYHCPFFSAEAPQDLRCHNSGGFSRRDTYKTHLRARHFIYPKGVKPQDRTKSSGHCAQCGQFFENTDQWVEQHIENGECKALPEGYNRNIKSERKSGKLRMIKVSTGQSRFISTAQSVVEPEVLLNKDALEAMAIVAHDTNGTDLLSRFGNNKIMMSSNGYKGVKSKATLLRKDKDFGYPTGELRLAHNAYTPLDASGPESMDDETALNEISSSINFSPHDHHVLEPVPSSSSQSSHEEPVVTAKVVMPPVVFNDPFSVPLDLEQCTLLNGTHIEDNTTYRKSRNDMANAEFDYTLMGQETQRNREQCMNFYNYTFDTNL